MRELDRRIAAAELEFHAMKKQRDEMVAQEEAAARMAELGAAIGEGWLRRLDGPPWLHLHRAHGMNCASRSSSHLGPGRAWSGVEGR
ncbi:hypothetical protein WMF18_13005 [Sorangium sp. So ce315]|uniref:hypothetical protein n=1 Tax=Sorangium sp. So ce315 TaxID=3133299 RepID=UPI003F64020E